MPSIGIVLSDEQHEILRRASSAAGFGLGPWLRGLGLSQARTMGMRVVDPEKQAAKAAHRAGVEARRNRRNAKRTAAVLEQAAWDDLARCQAAEFTARSSGDPEAIATAEAARLAADSAAVAAREKRESLEA